MNPTQALIKCADLSRGADPSREICHVCLERRDDAVIIMATDGHLVFRFDFRVKDFPADHWVQKVHGSWHAPGAHFPKWGSKHWEVDLSSEMLHLTSCTKTGRPSRAQPPAVALSPGVGPALALWGQVTRQSSQIKINVSSGALADCVEILDGDAIVHLCSPDGVGMVVTAGKRTYTRQWRALVPVSSNTSPFDTRAIRASLLWEALDVCRPVHMLLSADNALAPVIFTSPAHTAIVMPMNM